MNLFSVIEKYPCSKSGDTCFQGYLNPKEMNYNSPRCPVCSGKAYVLPPMIQSIFEYLQSKNIYGESEVGYGQDGGYEYHPLLYDFDLIDMAFSIHDIIQKHLN